MHNYRGENERGRSPAEMSSKFGWLAPPSDAWGDVFVALSRRGGERAALDGLAALLRHGDHREQVRVAPSAAAPNRVESYQDFFPTLVSESLMM